MTKLDPPLSGAAGEAVIHEPPGVGRASEPKLPPEPHPRAPLGEGVTSLLKSWAAGDHRARERLFEVVYPELRKLAEARLRREPRQPSIQATELVSEAYLRLIGQERVDWQSRAQFFALSATMIRRILVDRAKTRLRRKRGAGAIHLSLEDAAPTTSGFRPEVDLLALDEALQALARIRATAVRIVELRYFAGLSVEETAGVMGIGEATVVRRWRFAKAWLAEQLGSPR